MSYTTQKNKNICVICHDTYSVTFIFISIARLVSLLGYSTVGYSMVLSVEMDILCVIDFGLIFYFLSQNLVYYLNL